MFCLSGELALLGWVLSGLLAGGGRVVAVMMGRREKIRLRYLLINSSNQTA